MQGKFILKLSRYIFGILMLLLLSACDWDSYTLVKNNSPKFASTSKKNLIIGNGSEPESLDPHKASGIPEVQILKDLFQSLTETDPRGEVVPGVAVSWENKDNKVWTFYLRKDAKWSNGKPVTAHDFVYAWQRLVDPNTASTYASYLSDMHVINADQVIQGKLPTKELGVRALDAYTFEITLNEPVAYLPSMLAHQSVFPVYRPVIEKYGNKWTQAKNMVSNGAYQLKTWYVNNRIIATKNPYYWDANNVKIEQIEYLPIVQPITDTISFMSGNSDITNFVLPPEIYSRLKKAYPDELKVSPQLCNYYYEINKNKKPLDDIRVRKALSLLIDRKKITDQVLKQGQQVSYSFTPFYVDNFRYYEPEWAKWSMQKRTEEAKRLLREAGFSRANPLKIELLYNTLEMHKTVALAVYSEWKKKVDFIEVSLVNKEWKSYLNSLRLGDFQVARRGWCGDYNEPSAFLNMYKSDSSNNLIKYNNPRYDQLLLKSLVTVDDQKRQDIYVEADQALMKDAVALVLYTQVAPRLVKPYVKGHIAKDPQGFVHSKDLYLEYQD